MPPEFILLQRSDFSGEVHIHSDLLSNAATAISEKRALKVGRLSQIPMPDHPEGSYGCVICTPELNPTGPNSTITVVSDRVARLVNIYPFLQYDQSIFFLWHSSADVRARCLHRVELRQLTRLELYWMIHACVVRGREFHAVVPRSDVIRHVAGLNLGPSAGQSLPHLHLQAGYEAVVGYQRVITDQQLALFFEELSQLELILHRDNRIAVVAPWTPKGAYAVDLYILRKHEIIEMDDSDLRVIAVLGERIVQKYRELGIENVNIVFDNSPRGRMTEPLVAHFVPRVNQPALYEIRGTNVVDTPPHKIAEVFRQPGADGTAPINWKALIQEAIDYDPDVDFDQRLQCGVGAPSIAHPDAAVHATKGTRER